MFLCVLKLRFGKRICISAVEGARNGSFHCVGLGHGLMDCEFRAAKDGWDLFLNVSRKSGKLRSNRACCPWRILRYMRGPDHMSQLRTLSCERVCRATRDKRGEITDKSITVGSSSVTSSRTQGGKRRHGEEGLKGRKKDFALWKLGASPGQPR